MTYVQWTLKSDYKFSLIVTAVLPVLWILMYVLGRIGKATSRKQMNELHDFMMKTLKKK